MAEANPKENSLCIRRTFWAPRERVFRAFTEPEALRRWLRPIEGVSTPKVEVDLRVGGAYRFTLQRSGDEPFHVVGTYREVRAPERLVYTWKYEGPLELKLDAMGDSLVVVEFHDLGDATEVVLIHELLPTKSVRDFHELGWGNNLDQLKTILANPPH